MSGYNLDKIRAEEDDGYKSVYTLEQQKVFAEAVKSRRQKTERDKLLDYVANLGGVSRSEAETWMSSPNTAATRAARSKK